MLPPPIHKQLLEVLIERIAELKTITRDSLNEDLDTITSSASPGKTRADELLRWVLQRGHDKLDLLLSELDKEYGGAENVKLAVAAVREHISGAINSAHPQATIDLTVVPEQTRPPKISLISRFIAAAVASFAVGYFLARQQYSDVRMVVLGSGNVSAYLQCYAPNTMSTARPLLLEGGSTAGMRLMLSAFHHGSSSADEDRPGLVTLLSESPESLWELPSIPAESRDAGPNYFYFTNIAEARPLKVYFKKDMGSLVNPKMPLGEPCKVSGIPSKCIDAEELWQWIYYKDPEAIRIGIPGTGSATRNIVLKLLCEEARRTGRVNLTCKPDQIGKELDPIPPWAPFDLVEELIHPERPFFLIGSEMLPKIADVSAPAVCGPLREDIDHAFLCQSVDSGICQGQEFHPYFLMGKWSISGKSYRMHPQECSFILAFRKELQLGPLLHLSKDCQYPFPDKPEKITHIQ